MRRMVLAYRDDATYFTSRTIAPITNRTKKKSRILTTMLVKNFSNSAISASLILRPGTVPVDPDLDPGIDVLEAAEVVDAVLPVALAEGDVTAMAAAAPVVVVAPAVA